ncbi:MATE efflux family protein [Marinomonas mediterranea MMB-1]|uniref:Multidrug-efflux transporter n=2 Tax=Marinomonas mediterranea TaxID=119864 RepID=F2JTQ3_MARM1|nr:MATE efflux family protein [Marinomonas mediterranea MMB-1]
MLKRISKKYPDLAEILHLLFPMVLTMTIELSISAVDTIMLGHYDALHLAAVGLAASLWLPLGCFLMGITFGLTPLITKHLHGRQIKLVNVYMSQAVGVCFVFGIIAALLTAFVLPEFAQLLANEPETQNVTKQYLVMIAPAIPMLALMTAYKNLYEAAGKPNLPLLIATLGLVINVVLNYVLIYGHFGFPEMGAEGAALASSVSLYLSVLIFVFFDRKINPSPLFSKLKWRYVKNFTLLLKVGVPAGFAFAFELGLFSSLTWLIAAFGDVALGAGQIVMSYSTTLFTPLMAMSAVTAIVVAKAISIEGIIGVKRRVKLILIMGVGYFCVCFMLTQTFYNAIPYIYSKDVEVATMAAGILLISSCYQLPDIVQTIFTGTLRGLRDTRTPMIAFGMSLFGLSIPLGYWLSHYSPWAETLTVRGFYLGLLAGLFLLAFLLIWRFRVLYRRLA